jgi:CRISPR-associated exonuclease Cas4
MDSSEADNLIPLSALQHWLYCPRQCALIHVERIWTENRLTAEGKVMHERVHEAGHETRPAKRTVRGLQIASRRLGVAGIADVVELHGPSEAPHPYPVEYKRGRPKAHRADEVQLCAQALCLEEMFNTDVPEGALFYGEPRRRTIVAIDAELRALTQAVASEARGALSMGRVPAPIYEARKCRACSLIEACRPQCLARAPDVSRWLAGRLAADAARPPCDDY